MNTADDIESMGIYSLNAAAIKAAAIAAADIISERLRNILCSISSKGFVGVSVGAIRSTIIVPESKRAADTYSF